MPYCKDCKYYCPYPIESDLIACTYHDEASAIYGGFLMDETGCNHFERRGKWTA
jgi:hypothetical protein